MTNEITFYTPSSLDDIARVYPIAQLLFQSYPYKLTNADILTHLEATLGDTTIVFIDDVPIGLFTLLMHKKSAELHGVFREDLSDLFDSYKAIKREVINLILRAVFITHAKSKLIIKADPKNKGVRGLAIIYGFEKLQNIERGHYVWKLTREKYLRSLKWAEQLAVEVEHPPSNHQQLNQLFMTQTVLLRHLEASVKV